MTEAHRTPDRRDPRRTTPRHTIIKMAKIKDKDRLLKAARERKKDHLQRKTQQAIIRPQQKPYRTEENGMIYLMQLNRKALNQEYCIQQDYHLSMKEGLNNAQTSNS